MRIELEQMRQELLERQIYVYVLNAWGEPEISAKGNKYQVVYVDYKYHGFSKLQSYRTAGFTQSGRLITKGLNPGNWYRVTVRNSERGFDEWVALEQIDERELAVTKT